MTKPLKPSTPMHRDWRSRHTAADPAGGTGRDGLDGGAGDGGRAEPDAGAIEHDIGHRVGAQPVRVWFDPVSDWIIDGYSVGGTDTKGNTVAHYTVTLGDPFADAHLDPDSFPDPDSDA